MSRRLFGGLLSRAAIPDYEHELIDNPAGTIVAANYVPEPAPAPAPVINGADQVIDPAVMYGVDVWGQIVPNIWPFDGPETSTLWGSSNGQNYLDLITQAAWQQDFFIPREEAASIALRLYPRAAESISRLGLRNWVILGTHEQLNTAFRPSVFEQIMPQVLNAAGSFTGASASVNSPDVQRQTGVYPWTPQNTTDGAPYVPEEAPAYVPSIAPPSIPLAPQTPLPVISPPATSTTAPGTSSATPWASAPASAGWIDNADGGVTLAPASAAPAAAPATGNNGKTLAVLGVLAALAYLNS